MRNKIVALSFVELIGYGILITGAVTQTPMAIIAGITTVIAAYVVGVVVFKRGR